MTRLTQRLACTLALALALLVAADPSFGAAPREEALPEGATARLGTLRFRNGGPLQAVRYLQNGKVVASIGSADQALRFWDAETGELRGQFVPPPGCPVAYSPDGRLAAVTEDRAVVLYDTGSGKVLQRLSDPKRLLSNPVFAPDGKTVATTLQTATELPDPADPKKGGDVQERMRAVWEAFRVARGMLEAVGSPPIGVRLWNVADGKKIRDLTEKKAAGVQDFVSMTPIFLPQQRVGFRGTRNGDNLERLVLWDERTGKSLPGLKDLDSAINGFTIAPDGKTLVRLVLQPADNSVRALLCDLASGKMIRNLGEPLVNAGPSIVTFSPDGKMLALGDQQGDVLHLIDVATGKETTTLTLEGNGNGVALGSVTFSPDGSLLAAPNLLQGSMVLYDVVKGTPKHEVKGAQLNFVNIGVPGGFAAGNQLANSLLGDGPWEAPVSFTPDGKRVAITGAGGMVKIFDLTTGKEIKIDGGHAAAVGRVVFSEDGRWLATVGEDNVAILWDRVAHTEKRRFVGPEIANVGDQGTDRTPVALSPDGKLLAVGWFDGKVQVWDADGKELYKLDAGETYVGALAFTPDGKRLASASADGNLFLWNLATGKQERALTGPSAGEDAIGEQALAVSPDGRFLAAVGPGGDGSRLRLWELTTAKVRLDVNFKQNAAAVRQEFRFVRGGVRIAQQVAGTACIGPLAFAPGGRFVAVGNGDVVLLVDLDHGREVRRFGFASGPVESVAFSPDGKTLAAVGGEGVARLWEVASATVTGHVDGHRGAVTCAAFSPDGKLLATGGADTTVLLWDAKTAFRTKTETPPEVTEKDLPALWDQLAAADAAAAFAALNRLAAAPARTVPWIRQKLPPAVAFDPRRVEQLLAQLEAEKADLRKEAMEQLTQIAEHAEPILRKRLAEGPPELTRFVIERLLERTDQLGPESLRAMRAVELLERIGTAESLALLRGLAKGAAGARLTLEAETAASRLALKR